MNVATPEGEGTVWGHVPKCGTTFLGTPAEPRQRNALPDRRHGAWNGRSGVFDPHGTCAETVPAPTQARTPGLRPRKRGSPVPCVDHYLPQLAAGRVDRVGPVAGHLLAAGAFFAAVGALLQV